METRIQKYRKNNKHRQLILIFGILGGSCIWSQIAFAEGQWIADKKGCKVWNGNPAQNESITWSGACVNGYANGHGVLQWYKSGIAGSRYEGQYLKGRKTGKGKLSINGNSYDGDWVEDKAQGKGTTIENNGIAMKGIG